MTHPEIHPVAVEAAAHVLYARDGYGPWEHEELDVLLTYRARAAEALAAALPHLRVQETPGLRELVSYCREREVYKGRDNEIGADTAYGDVADRIEEMLATPAPRPVVDRYQLITVLEGFGQEPDGEDEGWVFFADEPGDIADAILALLPTEEDIKGEVHLVAVGAGVTSCCGRSPFELPRDVRITIDPSQAHGCGGESL